MATDFWFSGRNVVIRQPSWLHACIYTTPNSRGVDHYEQIAQKTGDEAEAIACNSERICEETHEKIIIKTARLQGLLDTNGDRAACTKYWVSH
jgi:uncharacterized ferredoxin-like protein